MKRIQYNLEKRFQVLSSSFKEIGLAWPYIVGMFLMLMIIGLLTINIWNVYSQGKRNFDQLLIQREKLDKLVIENEDLKEEIEYKKSPQYIESFAQENLYLSRLGERIFKIEDQDKEVYELEEINSDPIELESNEEWWKEIFL
ncbi:MAG TPA: septum formation initiator family protein [Candidatus Dojkabacteria bacterium]|jgi:cell division protein FtsB